MKTEPRFALVRPELASEFDIELLRACMQELAEEQTKNAFSLFIDGLMTSGAVVSKLDNLLTPKEAAEMMGVSRQYVDKLVKMGKLKVELKPASKHRVIRVSEIVAFRRHLEKRSDQISSTLDELVEAGLEY